MQKQVVVYSSDVIKSKVTWFCAGVFAGVMMTVGFVRYAEHQFQQQLLQEPGIVKACNLPDVNGAMTVFIMEDNKMKCWRWK